MKTVLCALEFPPAFGGVETYYAQLSNYWPEEMSVIDNHEQALVNKKLPFFSWLPACFTISRTIKNSKPDWFIAGEILPIGTAMWFLSHFVNFRYAVVLHGLDFSLATQVFWKKFIAKKVLNKAKVIICANSYTAKLVSEFINDTTKVNVINPGIDAQLPSFRPGLAHGLRENYGLEHCFVLLSIGRLVKRKGVDAVISALSSLKTAIPKIKYVVIGSGPEKEPLHHAVEKLDLQSQVIFLESVDNESKWAWLSICDALIMPSRNISGDYEGFGIVYLEANMFSRPVIAGKSGGVSDAVQDMRNGLVIDEESPEAIAEAIQTLNQDRNLAEHLGEQGKAWVQENFNWKHKAQSFYDILKKAL